MKTYEDLKKAVAVYLGWDAGGEIEEYLPQIIRLAEVRMQRDVNLRCMERTGYRYIEGGQSDVWLPEKRIDGDWDVFSSMREVALEGQPNINLHYGTPDDFTDYSGQVGQPIIYTLVGRTMRVAPIPEKQYKILLTYYAEIPPLSDIQKTNEVLLTYPDLYLYSSIIEAIPLLRSSEPLEIWNAKYKDAMISATDHDRRARFSRHISARPPRSRRF